MIDFKRQSSPNGRRKLDTNLKFVVPSNKARDQVDRVQWVEK